MTIDVHETCQSALNAFNIANIALDALMPEYDRAKRELLGDTQDVLEICGALNLTEEDIGKFLDRLYISVDALESPKFWHEFINALVAREFLIETCLIERAGALQSESAFRRIEERINELEKDVELRRRNYVGCIQKALFQKSRREGTIGPPL